MARHLPPEEVERLRERIRLLRPGFPSQNALALALGIGSASLSRLLSGGQGASASLARRVRELELERTSARNTATPAAAPPEQAVSASAFEGHSEPTTHELLRVFVARMPDAAAAAELLHVDRTTLARFEAGEIPAPFQLRAKLLRKLIYGQQIIPGALSAERASGAFYARSNLAKYVLRDALSRGQLGKFAAAVGEEPEFIQYAAESWDVPFLPPSMSNRILEAGAKDLLARLEAECGVQLGLEEALARIAHAHLAWDHAGRYSDDNRPSQTRIAAVELARGGVPDEALVRTCREPLNGVDRAISYWFERIGIHARALAAEGSTISAAK